MDIEIQLTNEPIAESIAPLAAGVAGAWVEFRGQVRGEENGAAIAALEYEAYAGMAEREMQRLLSDIGRRQACLAVKVIHRTGVIPAGETAIYLGVAAKHRAEALALLAEFMDRLKQDVPVWKRRAVPAGRATVGRPAGSRGGRAPLQLEDARAAIRAGVQPLAAVSAPLAEAAGRVLRERVAAAEDAPDIDRSTRDGYALRQADGAEVFEVVDTLHAADWKPRWLKAGEAVRVATGAALPCQNLRVVMQENVERTGDRLRVLRPENAVNVRRRGEGWRAGDTLLPAGKILDAGALALLAAAGCARPMVSPKLRALHFTTGDEIVPPDAPLKPGQVRDSNSILMRVLLQKHGCEVTQKHLPENFALAQKAVAGGHLQPAAFPLVLISGGAGGGEKDFTRALLEWLGFEIVFDRVNLRPGAPLIFGVNGERAAFGLPGNPLSHWVCFHLLVAAALKKFSGAEAEDFLSGTLAEDLDEAPNARETWWPARLRLENGRATLSPLRWSSSGDVAGLAEASALLRVPANAARLAAGAEVSFLPA